MLPPLFVCCFFLHLHKPCRINPKYFFSVCRTLPVFFQLLRKINLLLSLSSLPGSRLYYMLCAILVGKWKGISVNIIMC